MAADGDAGAPERRVGHAGAAFALAGVILTALAVRIWLGWWIGFLGDLQAYQVWSLDPGELPAQYRSLPIPPKNYPPIYPSLLKLMRWVHRELDLPGDYRSPFEVNYHGDPPRHRPLILYLKLPSMVADAISGVIIFLLACHFRRPWLGVGLAVFYLFSPVILYDGAYYGQTDTILVTFLIAALAAYITRRAGWLGAMLAAAALMKAQAVFALPVFAAGLLGEWRPVWRVRCGRLLAGAVVALAIVAVLAALAGQLGQFRDGYFGIVGLYPRVTSRAFNFWWLVTRPWDKAPVLADFPPDTAKLFGLIAYKWIGAGLFFAALGLILWRLHKARYTPYALTLALTAAGWSFFNWPTQMHERYSVPAVGLMCLLPFWKRRWLGWALLASTTTMLNIAEVCPFFFPPCRPLVRLVNTFIWGEMQATWTIFAVIHVLMVPLTIEALWREGRPPGVQASSGGFPVMAGHSAPLPPAR